MWAYGNHYRVDVETWPWHVVYDSGVACIFRQVSCSSTQDQNFVMGNLAYVGVLKEILVVDYVGLPMVMFKCSWIPSNTQGNTTIHQDEHGFWVRGELHMSIATHGGTICLSYVCDLGEARETSYVSMNKYIWHYRVGIVIRWLGWVRWNIGNVWLLDVATIVIMVFNYNVIIQKLHNLTCNLNYDYGNVGVFLSQT